MCFFKIFICKPKSCTPDSQLRDALFEVIINNCISHRFDTSHKFWEKYSVGNESLRKKLGYFLIENTDDPCTVTAAVNPKEYFEEFESQVVNRKSKGLRKGTAGMEFEDYAKRINSIKEIEAFGQLPMEKQKQNRFAMKNNEMMLEEIEKSKFVQINDKRYYFSDGIVSLPFSHPFLLEMVKFKGEKKNKKLKHFTTRKT